MFVFVFEGALFEFADPTAQLPPLFRFAPKITPRKMSRLNIFKKRYDLVFDLAKARKATYPDTLARKPPPTFVSAAEGARFEYADPTAQPPPLYRDAPKITPRLPMPEPGTPPEFQL